MVIPTRMHLPAGKHPSDYDLEVERVDLFQSKKKKFPDGAVLCRKCKAPLRSIGSGFDFCALCIAGKKEFLRDSKPDLAEPTLEEAAIKRLEKEYPIRSRKK